MDVGRNLRRFVVLAVAAGLPLVAVVPAQASDTVGEKQTVDTGANTLRTPMAQTFTAGSAGQVDRISLEQTFTYLTETVQLQSVVGGKPNGNVLGTSSFSGALGCCHRWVDFNFSPTVPVTTGTQYAIVVTTTANLTWYDSYYFDAYTKGQMWLMVNGAWSFQPSYGRDFTFQEWLVSGNTNQSPVVTANNSAVTAPEGSTATNTGTYTDPDGDNVALSASAGTLTKTGTSGGSWSWSLLAADEAPVQTVTITANDGRGATAPVTFTAAFTPVTPTVTITGAPANGPEGTAITLTGKAQSPSAADQTVGFTFTWTVTKNGNPFATGTGASMTFTPDDEGTFAVTLQAVDDGGNGASVAATVNGQNVAPAAKISGVSHDGIVLLPFTPVTVTGGFTDPGALDTHTATVNYGDGTPADTWSYAASGSGDISDTHAYSAPGTYTITYAVQDDDNGSSTATTTVTVQTPADALATIQGYVARMASLNHGEKNALAAKYRAAADSAARGDTNAACGQIDAAMNDLSAMTGNGKLSAADSAVLSSATWSVHRALGCTKVKVAWLSLSL